MTKNIPPGSTFSLFLLFLFLFFSGCCNSSTLAMNPVNYNVGVIIDLDTWSGKMELSCINMSLSDLYAAHPSYTTRLRLHPRNSHNDVVLTAAAGVGLIKDVEVQAIIGPSSSMEANFLINLGDKARVPIISFSATSPSLTSSSIRSPYFFRAAQNDSLQVTAISDIVRTFGWRKVVPIYVDNEFGEGVIPYLSDALQEIDVQIAYRSVIPPNATDKEIEAELYKLMTMQTRVFIVHMLPALGSRIFEKAKKLGMMEEGYVWIATTGISNEFGGSLNRSFITENMQGVVGLKTHFPKDEEKSFRVRWKNKFQQENPTAFDVNLDVFGLWAYDCAKALAMAVEQVGSGSNFTYEKMNSSGSSNDLENFGVSHVGPHLVRALRGTSFKGISGNFSLVNGQLESSTFEIVNLIGNGEKGIGFWTSQNGLMQNFSSTSNGGLKSISWPGDISSTPRGWQIPTSPEKKLRIVVPVKAGFQEFVNVIYDVTTNKTNVTGGCCLDIFKAVTQALPYDLSYDFYAYAKPNGESNGSYDDMVKEVSLGNYDGAVGDITITSKRFSQVDFTLPYTESGVYMVVPVKDNSKNTWVFLDPLTGGLWLTTGCFFVFIGFVVWVLEHRINEDFRGPKSHQIGTSFWFAFSTMAFAHRERVVSNLARFVVVVWCVVVLILTQSYTASLTSMLTYQQLQPRITDVNWLLNNGHSVGYLQDSFVKDILKSLGFTDEKRLKVYNSSEFLHELFQKGSANGGISAAFDETPYIKLFLATYCSKYMMVDPSFKTDGFAFVFPKNSPLTRDVSSEILKLYARNETRTIEGKWFNKSTCPDPNNNFSSRSLGLESFWGLFLIAGVVSSAALLIHVATFLYEHKHILMRSDSTDSFWTRILVILRKHDLKDLESHTFKRGTTGLEDHANIEAQSVYDEHRTPPTEHGQSSPDIEPQPTTELTYRPRGTH